MISDLFIGARVIVAQTFDTGIPLFTEGTVITVDTKRSAFGYFFEVEWDTKLGDKHQVTWITDRCIKLVDESVREHSKKNPENWLHS